jgi:CDP-diacylglycerol--serine O-phosphatidyltransferase
MKDVPLLPSLFTTGNLFCGTLAIVFALNNNYFAAAWCILIAIGFDLMDGQIARLKNMASKFGVEYDSLADLVSFGVAPAMMAYLGYLKDMGRLGIALFFIFLACTALRLARFNSQTQKASTQKISFSGLPTPGASGFIASIFIVTHKYPLYITGKVLPIVVLVLAALMVSNIRYPATGVLNLWKRNPFFNLVAFILCGAMIFLQPEVFVFLCFLGYVFSGFAIWKWYNLNPVGKTITERSEHESV